MKLPSHFNSVKGFIDHDEGICLYNHALDSSKKGPILEIGSYCGKSTIYIATAAKKYSGCVYSVDHHTGSEENQVGWEYHDIELFDEEINQMILDSDVNITYVTTVSRPGDQRNTEWIGEVGRANTIVEKYIEQFGLSSATCLVYTCGHPGMIEDVKQKLGPRGFKVKEERYWKD